MVNKELSDLVNKYINENILNFNNILTNEIDLNDYEKSIINRLCACKWSKRSQFPEARDYTLNKVKNILDKKMPFIFCFCFGGYKHWWSDSYPEPDWAEIFNIRYLIEYVLPIANTYNYGVTIEYESEEVALSYMNNTPQKGMDLYNSAFKKILEIIKLNCNYQIDYNYVLAREQYDREVLIKRMIDHKGEVEKRFNALSKEEQDIRLKRAETNIMWNGNEDLTKISDIQKKQIIYNSRILNESFLDVDYELRGASYFEKENLIPLVGTFGLGAGGESWLHLLSTKSSLVDFWSGIGILEIREEKIIPKIISMSQYEKIKESLIKIDINNNIFNNVSKNFSYIYVYKGTLPF